MKPDQTKDDGVHITTERPVDGRERALKTMCWRTTRRGASCARPAAIRRQVVVTYRDGMDSLSVQFLCSHHARPFQKESVDAP
jgi:hypothetical protein